MAREAKAFTLTELLEYMTRGLKQVQDQFHGSKPHDWDGFGAWLDNYVGEWERFESKERATQPPAPVHTP